VTRVYRELGPALWPAFEQLFGQKGACGGCWCMAWRVERGGAFWDATKGERARELMRELVTSGRAHGMLAFDGETPVGWCSFGPRADFPRLERVKAYRRDDTAGVWSINCFYIPRGRRGQGLSRALLGAVIEACRRHGAAVLEGYPATLTQGGEKLPAAFAWMGPLAIFEEAGFEVVQRLSPSRPLVRLTLD
jgi:GNAT superfamily N-acetyltransferase